MDSSTKEIISHLKFIGMVKKYQKINVANLFVQSPGLVTSLSRSLLYRDSRSNALQFIESTLTRSFEIVLTYKDSDRISELSICQNIIQDMIKAQKGMENLKITYKDDNRFICDLETIQQTIVPRLQEVKNIKPDLFIFEEVEKIFKVRNSSESSDQYNIVESKNQESLLDS